MEKPKQQSSTSDLIPVDLLIDIFSRVPANSIARFRCVSKFWESILRRPDFTELFLTKSVARPRLLFAFKVNEELLFFSSPQPQSPDEISCLVATPYKYFPKKNLTKISTPLCGLVFLQSWERKAPVVCNPVTGDSITLPKVNATCFGEFYFGFGFDPVSKQFKVLCMKRLGKRTPNTHHWILKVESGKLLWRTVDCKPYYHHYNTHDEICINGVLYYGGYFEESNIIVSFDFRSEKFSFINRNEGTLYEEHWTLFNYKGKLGAYDLSLGRLMLWVLEDAGKHKWSKSICILPSIVSRNMFVGMTGIGEIVFSPYMCYLSDPFYIFFYNIERKTYTRVNIKGFEEFKDHFTFVHTLIDFVEDMKFM